MSAQTVGLLAVASVFAVVNGMNDGGPLIAVGLSIRGLSRVIALLALTAGIVVAPLVVGTAVATTLAGRLVGSGDTRTALVLVAAAGTAIVVTSVLALRGLPTSLTLALIGGFSGVGLGAGMSVSWSTLGFVLAIGAVAPLVGLLTAVALTAVAARTPIPEGVWWRVRWLHAVGFLGICTAYGANDGQKMLAVFALAAGAGASASAADGDVARVVPEPWMLAAIAACFIVGALVGVGRYAGTIVGGVVPARPDAAVTTELSSASVVLGSAALGTPVSMTQAVSGALVGTGVSGGRRSVRWRLVIRIAWAWVITLPVSFGIAALVGLVVTTVS